MDYLYLNFDDSNYDSELLGGGLYTGTKLFLFKGDDFKEAADIKVSGLASTKSNVMNMLSIDNKLTNKGYYVDANKLNRADLIMSNVESVKRKAYMAGFELSLKTVLSFVKSDDKKKLEKDIKRKITKLPISINIDNFDSTSFNNNKDETVKKLMAHIKSTTKLEIDTAVLITFGVLSNTVSYVKTFTAQELESVASNVAKEEENVNTSF